MPIEERAISGAASFKNCGEVKATDNVARTQKEARGDKPLTNVNWVRRGPGTVGVFLEIGASQHPKCVELSQGR
jgi:hypothetical protein